MAQYRVNKNQQSSGDYEVHKQGCRYFDGLTNFEELGEHPTCQSAISKAQSIVGNSADGCSICIPECHTTNSIHSMESTSSCIPKEPLIKLDQTGKASILNYSLPQSTSYSGTAFLSLDIPDSYFKTSETESIWVGLQEKTLAELIDLVTLDINTQGSVGIFENIELLNDQDIQIIDLEPAVITTIEGEQRTARIISSGDQSALTGSNSGLDYSGGLQRIAIVPIEYIASMILQGLRPVLYTTGLGKVVRVKFVKIEDEANESPELMIALELKMSSYLGDYGAGKTLKTFSLLPGEQTSISIRTYQHRTDTKILAENVLDSYSENSAKDLQNSIQNEVNHTTNYSQNETETKTKNWKAGGNFGLNLGIFRIGGQGGTDHTAGTNTTINSALQTQVGMLVNSTSHHVAKSDSLRQIDVNSEVSSTTTEEYEETIDRILENINRSRVLNFVFRQLLQEFISITYIDDVSFIFYGGLKNRKTCRLASLDDLISSVIEPGKVQEVKSMIYTQLCNVKDHNGDTHSLIEKITETYKDCISGSKKKKTTAADTVEYVRMRKDLTQSYMGREVNGVILDTTHRILRTPSLIIDSLLGHGEALDCYNQKLQSAATLSAELENKKLEQSIKVLDSIEDPVKRAEMYKRVFGECCDVPQCGCHKTHLEE
jgi:hypothetical protein